MFQENARGAAAATVSLHHPAGIADLLWALRMAEASDAISIPLARDPASHADLDNRQDAAFLLRELNQVGASDAIGTLHRARTGSSRPGMGLATHGRGR
jgi:hypothetical protein